MSLSNLCDLHCHYVPNVDDGVKSLADGLELCRNLAQLGYTTVVATPHIRSGMFDNNKAALSASFHDYAAAVSGQAGLPELGLAAEHFFNDEFLELLASGDTLPYPGGHAALVEFPPERMPLGVEDCFFRMQVRGLRPVIAHPERYADVWRSPAPIERLAERGALPQLDLMSLVGKYGRKPKHAAERLLEAGLYYVACSDSHKPADVELVAQGIARLVELLGETGAQELLSEHPRCILAGSVAD